MSTLNLDLQAVLQQGVKKTTTNNDRFQGKAVLTKMFTPIVDKNKGEKEKVYRVRILPNPPEMEERSPFKEVEHHVMKINGQNVKLVCPKELGEDCPLCEVHDHLSASDDIDDKENAKKYRKRSYYIVRVIERGRENEGVKFWRFPRNFKGQGVFDKIKAKINIGIDPIDPNNGFDLYVTAVLDDSGRFTVISDISTTTPSPLAGSEDEINKLIYDDVKWSEVFKVKDRKYLEDVIEGKVQYWDNNLKRYVTPGQENDAEETQPKKLSTDYVNFDEQISKELNLETKQEETVKQEKPVVSEQKVETPITSATELTVDDIDDDDLPF